MNRPRLVRALRIAWSVVCGIAAVLLLCLWVRSYWTADTVYVPLPNSWNVMFRSIPGACMGGIFKGPDGGLLWETETSDDFRQEIPRDAPDFSGIWGRFLYVHSIVPFVIIPDWFLVGVALALSTAPWFRWSTHFSLRTLLIAITLVAMVLGVVAWLSH
jgi:hypothetical protein